MAGRETHGSLARRRVPRLPPGPGRQDDARTRARSSRRRVTLRSGHRGDDPGTRGRHARSAGARGTPLRPPRRAVLGQRRDLPRHHARPRLRAHGHDPHSRQTLRRAGARQDGALLADLARGVPRSRGLARLATRPQRPHLGVARHPLPCGLPWSADGRLAQGRVLGDATRRGLLQRDPPARCPHRDRATARSARLDTADGRRGLGDRPALSRRPIGHRRPMHGRPRGAAVHRAREKAVPASQGRPDQERVPATLEVQSRCAHPARVHFDPTGTMLDVQLGRAPGTRRGSEDDQ